MDARSRSSKILKESDANRVKPSSQSYRLHSEIMDNRSPTSSKYSDTHSKRARLSLSNDQGQPNSFPSASSSNFESPECSPNNSSILHRVTNTVSGLFSNVSWSEWLKGPGTPSAANQSASEAPRHDSHLLNPLYPEEGIACVSSTEMASSSSHQYSTDKSEMPMKMNIPSFKDQSFISSTPTLSPYPKKRKVNEEYLCDSIISKPSTSDYRREISTPQENSINLLKKSFPEAHIETYNGSIVNAFPSGRKRLREALEEGKEENVSESTYQNLNKKRPLPNQMFSEETDTPLEPISRKRPRFNISTYGSPLYGKVAEEEEPSFSIFYPGKIMYGGASNHQKKKNRIIPRKVCTRTPTSNPTNEEHSDGGLSSAARRILDCIDKISTPLSASKRAFDFNHSRDYSFSSSPYVADFHKHRPSLKTDLNGQAPPTNKLLTPAKVKITKNFSSLFEVKTPNVSTEHKETSVVNFQASGSNNLNKASPLKTFASPSTANPARKDIHTPSINQSNNIKSFFAEKRTPTVEHNKKMVNETSSSGSGFKFPSTERVSNTTKKFEEKRTTNGDINKDNTARRSDLDNTIQYSFSKPDIVSGTMNKEILPICTSEFKFSQPINEVESKKDVQPFGFSLKKDSCSWDCNTCLLRNKGEDEKCVACTASKPIKVPSQTVPLNTVDPFKKSAGSWDCDMCLLRNKNEDEKCVACTAPKPSKVTKPTILATAADPFKKSAGSWDCETCLLQNKNEDQNCVACMAVRCNKPAPPPKPAITGFNGSWGDTFKPASGSWDCEMCMLQNKSSVNKCAACETPKSTSGQKKPVNNTFGTTTSFGSWGDSFKPVESSWTCDTCKMKNTTKSFTCTGCKTPKSNLSKNESDDKAKSSNFSFGIQKKDNSFKEKDKLTHDVDNNWICSICTTTNKITDLKCSSCLTAKPNLAVNDSFKNIQTSSFDGFGSKFLKPKDEWECDTCLVRNKSTAQKCASCETSRTGATSTSVSEVFKGNFKFGANSSQTKSSSHNFSFGSNSKPLDVNNVNTLQFKSITEPAKEENAISFKFGTDAKPSEKKSIVNPLSSNTPSFPEKKDSILPEKANDIKTTPLSSSTFVFGNPMSSTTSSTSTTTKTTTVTPFSKPLLVNTENKTQEKKVLPTVETKATPLFQFGTSVTESKLEFPKMNSNTSTQPELSKVNPSTFSFFGNTAAPAAAPSTFGTPEAKAPFTSESNTSNPPLLAFGSKEVKSSNNGFNFGGADANKPGAGVFAFGNVESKPNTSFNFGNAEPSKPSTTGVFNFGNVDASKPSPGGFNFGPKSAPLFKFGQQSSNAFTAPTMKPLEAPPASLNIETTNPFNVLASSSGAQPQKRVIKKGFRRLHK